MEIYNRTCFAQGVAHLLIYQTANRNMDVDETYLSSDGFPLGEFVLKVREAELGKKLETWQKEKLKSIGFALEKADQPWESLYTIVKEYAGKNNGALPKATERTKDNVLIGAWVRQQVFTFRHLSKKKQKLLREIGIAPNGGGAL